MKRRIHISAEDRHELKGFFSAELFEVLFNGKCGLPAGDDSQLQSVCLFNGKKGKWLADNSGLKMPKCSKK